MKNKNSRPARQSFVGVCSPSGSEVGICSPSPSEAKNRLRYVSGLFVFLFVLSVLAPLAFAQPATVNSTLYAPSQQNFGFDNYVRATLSAAALMAALMALAYMGGMFLQNEDAKQLARTEFLQTAASVLLAVILLGVLLGVDTGLRMTSGEIVSPCEGRTLPANMAPATLLNQYAFCYMQNLNEMAIAQGDTSIQKAVSFAKKAYHMEGFQSDMWQAWYFGLTRRPDAHLRLDSEVMGQEFALLTTYMISLQGQLLFLQYVVPALAPALLFLGVILRSLFFTRKLGGLMLAAGAGLLLVWPATYLLSWFTLQVSVFGPSVMGDEPDTTCPASCKILPPTGYNVSIAAGGKSWGTPGPGSPHAQGALGQKDMMAVIRAGTPRLDLGNETAWLDIGIQTCYPEYPYTQDKKTGKRTYTQAPDSRSSVPVEASDQCPAECRYLPTPTDQSCNLAACDKVPLACKAIRAMNLTAQNPPDNCQQCEKSCPAFCHTILPQVKYADAANPKAGVVPTTNANNCSVGEGDATQCPLYCRSYLHADTNTISYSTPDCQAACQKTLEKKTDASFTPPQPDCMLGIPAALVECNKIGVCGPAMHLEDAINSAKTNLCPVECRVYFNSSGSEDAFKDPTFKTYCEGTFKTACQDQCPLECKVKAGPQNATQPNSFSLGVPSSFIAQTDTGSTITCAKAPTFTNGQMDSDVNGNCARCPLSCRFRNPPSVVDMANQRNYFLSRSHYALECRYSADSPLITYGGACTDSRFPSNWLKFASEEPAGMSAGIVQHDPPACAPTAQIYLRSADSDPLCPIFLAPVPPYIKEGSLKDVSGGHRKQAIIPPNADVSAECSTPDAQKYCAEEYCPSLPCKPDRATAGPFYCHLSNQYSPLSAIPDNAVNCSACSIDNADHSLGPQCQVWLTDSSGAAGRLPGGCSQACNPSAFDPKSAASCNGFCYPRLTIPSGGSCGAYQDAPSGDPNSREFASCAACPTDCRYDYLTAAGAKRPTSQDNYCGWKFGTPVACVNCARSAGDTDAHALNNGEKNLCQDPAHYYDCHENSPVKPSGQWWFKSLAPDIVEYDKQYTHPCAPSDDKCKAYETSMTDQGYTYATGPIYQCTALHKYPALDSLVASSGGNSDYRECGDISLNGQNPSLNLCGARIFGGAPVELCKNDRASADSCFAHFNALAVACMPMTGVADDYTDPANNPTKADESCQNCPLFCRVDGGSSSATCDSANWQAGGAPPQCGVPGQCDLRASPSSGPPQPPGFCGVPLSVFNLVPSGPCQPFNNGSGVGCPARCRITIPGLAVPFNCSGGDIGEACTRGSLNSACTAQPPGNPCAGCSECETDCRSVPYVRQSCDEVCLPTDFGSGASPVTPKDLLMAWEGASGNPDWRSLGSLGIAAFLLPIFNIIITLAFIRTLSPVLGGDIEIPGILKVL